MAETSLSAAGSADVHAPPTPSKHKLFALALSSLGVVFGDIGTSPLYAFRETLAAGVDSNLGQRALVLGVLSLIVWSLAIVVAMKYVAILLRADNHGEGGTLSLMALGQRGIGRQSTRLVLLGIIGAALFYGDATITPAISVLSAVEGLEVLAPSFSSFVLPVTVLILIALFAVQRTGTARVSTFFGPITAIWFIVLAVSGIVHLIQEPSVLAAVNPVHGIRFLVRHGFVSFLILGGVFLSVTGAEALYADLGHFGRKPITAAWFVLVFPALVLNYLGHGALVLSDPTAARNPFFLMFPDWLLLPVVILATGATVIAAQAVITGAFSLSRQAIQLGPLPRMRVLITSETQTGQIYMPRINWLLFTAVVIFTLAFGSSANLASAYGISVSATMVVDAILAFVVFRYCWGWSLLGASVLIAPFLIVDVSFVIANLAKIESGGWVPVMLGSFLVLIMVTWRRGAQILFDKARRLEVPLHDLVRRLEKKPPHRVPGTAIFLTGDPEGAPTALLHNLKHNRIIHEHNIILSIRTAQTPRVPEAEKIAIEAISPSFQRITMTFGFMETPDVLKGLSACRKRGVAFDIMSTSFFLSRRSLKASSKSGMPVWQDKIFIALAGSADSATDYFHIPADRAVEIGAQVTV